MASAKTRTSTTKSKSGTKSAIKKAPVKKRAGSAKTAKKTAAKKKPAVKKPSAKKKTAASSKSTKTAAKHAVKKPATKKTAQKPTAKKSAAKKPAAKKSAAKKVAAKKPSASRPLAPPAPAPAPAPPLPVERLIMSVAGTDRYAVFGPSGPVLWTRGLELNDDDLDLWRLSLAQPEESLESDWRHSHRGEERSYALSASREVPGHVVANSEPKSDDDRIEDILTFAGAKHGNLFMVFAGLPTSFADDDFEEIHTRLHSWGITS